MRSVRSLLSLLVVCAVALPFAIANAQSTPTGTLNPSPRSPGSPVTATGANWTPGDAVMISWDGGPCNYGGEGGNGAAPPCLAFMHVGTDGTLTGSLTVL